MIYGQGKLIFDYVNFRVTDGVNYFIPLSPSLIRKLIRRKNRADGTVGEYLVWGWFVVWFRKGAK